MKAQYEFKTEQEYQEYLRIYFAAMAMQGLISNAPNGHLSNSKQGVQLATDWADELIKQLNQPI